MIGHYRSPASDFFRRGSISERARRYCFIELNATDKTSRNARACFRVSGAVVALTDIADVARISNPTRVTAGSFSSQFDCPHRHLFASRWRYQFFSSASETIFALRFSSAYLCPLGYVFFSLAF
ncbi:MAG: hypothetical protein AB8G17_13480 [Gammaproteobacteria bacterium]